MSKMCAWASMSEAGTTDGTPGDQTGSEVKRGEWYQFGQDEVFRWKNDALGRMAAALAGGIANNDHVGYGQSDRLTFFYAWRAVNYDISRVTSDVNVDCSAFICAIVNACGSRATRPVLHTIWRLYLAPQDNSTDTPAAAGQIPTHCCEPVT